MKSLFIVSLALAAQIAVVTAHATGDSKVVFTSKSVLQASQEVTETDSEGLGNGIITFDRRYKKADIKVTFTNLSGAFTRLHLHCNVRGSNGPIAIGIVDLLPNGQDNNEQDNSEVATLDSNTVIGTITNAEFLDADPCVESVGRSITNLRSLARAIDHGEIYFNLHSTAFPAGELRGQIEPLTRKRVRKDD